MKFLAGEDETQISRMVFRRLSQTTQTDILLGNLDMSNTHERLIIRPRSVQVSHVLFKCMTLENH